jgi:hypothetical protein
VNEGFKKRMSWFLSGYLPAFTKETEENSKISQIANYV